MSVLTNERKILREAYLDADQALEYLSSELGKTDELWISETATIFTANLEQPALAREAIKQHLRTKPMGYFENTVITDHLASLIFGMHAVGLELRDVNHLAEVVLEHVRTLSYAEVTHHTARRPRDDRQQSDGRPPRLLSVVPGQPTDEIGGHWRGQAPDPGSDQPPDAGNGERSHSRP